MYSTSLSVHTYDSPLHCTIGVVDSISGIEPLPLFFSLLTGRCVLVLRGYRHLWFRCVLGLPLTAGLDVDEIILKDFFFFF